MDIPRRHNGTLPDMEGRVHAKIMAYGLPEAILHFSEDERRYYDRYVEAIVYPKR